MLVMIMPMIMLMMFMVVMKDDEIDAGIILST